MQALVEAVLAKDVAATLACFSTRRPWRLLSLGDGTNGLVVPFAKLRGGLAPEGDFRDVIFGDDGDDSLRAEMITNGTKWRQRARHTFVPPESSTATVRVRWRKESDRFVVDEIAFPH
jgi:hypothetical protein